MTFCFGGMSDLNYAGRGRVDSACKANSNPVFGFRDKNRVRSCILGMMVL